MKKCYFLILIIIFEMFAIFTLYNQLEMEKKQVENLKTDIHQYLNGVDDKGQNVLPEPIEV